MAKDFEVQLRVPVAKDAYDAFVVAAHLDDRSIASACRAALRMYVASIAERAS